MLSYMGNTYTRLTLGPRGQSDAFFGITGTPDTPGFTRMSASHSFTATITNLAPIAAPEPGSLALLGFGLISGSVFLARVVRRQHKNID